MQTSAHGISFNFDASTGLLDGFRVEDGGLRIAPLHRAPWVGTNEAMPPEAAPLMARLGGDFFCAPFALAEPGVPLHGWPPNAPWKLAAHEPGLLRAVLTRTVCGATLVKELSVADGHPFDYQRHIFIGGAGRLPVSNHANLSLPNGGLIRTSTKRIWETPATAQESDPARGRSALRYPAQSVDPRVFPGVDGPSDLTHYPWNPRHEDFVVAIEAPGHWLGWAAVTRPVEGDLFLSLRNAHALPMSMFWHSNGGRDYPPWSGRHFGCLGVEEGAAAHMLGKSTEADLIGPGALTLTPAGLTEVRHVIGAVAWPSREGVADIVPGKGVITIIGEGGTSRQLRCQTDILKDS